MLPAAPFDCRIPPHETTSDGRLVYSAGSVGYVLVKKCGLSREQARGWLLEVTTDTSHMGTHKCITCPQGQFQSKPAQADCLQCPQGSFAPDFVD